MPNTDFISKMLEIEDLIVDEITTSSTSTHIFFHLARRDQICPCCGAITNKVPDYRTSILKDTPFQGRHLLLHYKKRRYHCDTCNAHFLEPFQLLPKLCRITNRLGFLAIHQLRNTMNVKSVATSLGVSSSTIFRRLQDINFTKPTLLPTVLSIDEFKGNAGGQKFQAILTNPQTHQVIDILPSRAQYQLQEYLRSFPNRKEVKYFVMDMNQVYRDLAETFLPNATIVIDKFHVVRYVTWALENVRKRIQKEMHPSKRKYFKRSRKILLSHFDSLTQDSKDALEVMFQQSVDLATAYYLKEQFYDVMSSQTREEAGKNFKNLFYPLRLAS